MAAAALFILSGLCFRQSSAYVEFLTACVRKQATPMTRWRAILEYSVDPYDFGEVQAISVKGVNRVQAIQHYTKLTDYPFKMVKPYFQ